MRPESLLSHIEPDGEIPPVDRWNPEHSADMDLVIRGDGAWLHEGAPVQRPRLLRLLSTILRREADGEYYLVTPVEKMHLSVEDRPFLIVDAEPVQAGATTLWRLTTNMGDRLDLGDEHRLVVSETPEGEAVPEVNVRFGLGARLNRNVYYRLIELAEQRPLEGRIALGIVSQGVWQPLGVVDAESP